MTGEQYATPAPEVIHHLSPNFPGSRAALPQLVQEQRFAIGIHALPESVVLVNRQLSTFGQSAQQSSLQHIGVVLDQIQHSWIERKEAAIDPAFRGLRLLTKQLDLAISYS